MRTIDADALIWVLKHSKTYYKVIALDVVLDAVRCSPTIEPKHGEWIEGETFYFCGEQQFPMTCSVCGRTALNEPWHFCPNCGARMKGADDE